MSDQQNYEALFARCQDFPASDAHFRPLLEVASEKQIEVILGMDTSSWYALADDLPNIFGGTSAANSSSGIRIPRYAIFIPHSVQNETTKHCQKSCKKCGLHPSHGLYDAHQCPAARQHKRLGEKYALAKMVAPWFMKHRSGGPVISAPVPVCKQTCA